MRDIQISRDMIKISRMISRDTSVYLRMYYKEFYVSIFWVSTIIITMYAISISDISVDYFTCLCFGGEKKCVVALRWKSKA